MASTTPYINMSAKAISINKTAYITCQYYTSKGDQKLSSIKTLERMFNPSTKNIYAK